MSKTARPKPSAADEARDLDAAAIAADDLAANPRPEPPADLRDAGRELWAGIVADLAPGWELDARELRLLARAGRCADDAAALEQAIDRDGATVEGSRGQTIVHPGIAEARQLRMAELRLLRDLQLENPAVTRSRATPSARRARRAAEARWSREAI
jgi:ketosteroid isomerase-like protein